MGSRERWRQHCTLIEEQPPGVGAPTLSLKALGPAALIEKEAGPRQALAEVAQRVCGGVLRWQTGLSDPRASWGAPVGSLLATTTLTSCHCLGPGCLSDSSPGADTQHSGGTGWGPMPCGPRVQVSSAWPPSLGPGLPCPQPRG